MTFWNPISWWLELFGRSKLDPQPDEDPPDERPDPDADEVEIDDHPTPDPEVDDELEPAYQLRSVGAWCGWGSFVNDEAVRRDIAFAKALGLGRLDVIVNDHSAKRQPMPFGTYNKSRIALFCKRAVDEGLHVHLMTWCMPHREYLKGLGTQMIDLVGQCGARSVMFDAEEPWTNAARPLPWEEAGALAAEVMQAVPFGVTGIGYASSKKLGPLVRRSKYMVPQCYSTAGNTLDPATASPRLSAGWKSKFGDRELVVGLAGYRQEGRPGYTKERFMTTAFNAALSAMPTDIVYWSLRQIRASRTTANIIRGLAQRASHRADTP